MPAPIPVDQRLRAVEAYQRGEGSLAQVAARYGLSPSSVQRFVHRQRTRHSLAPTTPSRRGPAPRLAGEDLAFLTRLLSAKPQASCDEILGALARERHQPLSYATLHRALQRLGISKQRPPLSPAPPAPSPPAAPPARGRYRDVHRKAPTLAHRAYPSDLTDAEWERVRPLVERKGGPGCPASQARRRILDALFYLSRSGCQWRMLPLDFPPWQTVASCFYRWKKRGLWERLCTTLRRTYREQIGREPEPSAGSLDSQSVKTTEKGGPKASMATRR